MAGNDKTTIKDSPFLNAMGAYSLGMLVGAGIGALVGFIIALSLGETYTVEDEHHSEDEVGLLHWYVDGNPKENYLTSTGQKWLCGGTGIGAALAFLWMFILRNNVMSTLKNPWRPMSSSQKDGEFSRLEKHNAFLGIHI